MQAARAINYRRVIQLAHDNLGTIALLENRIDDAHAIFLKSLRITSEDGQAREQLGSLRDIATVCQRKGHLEKAVELLAVILRHPAREQNSLYHRESLKIEAERLLEEIETKLSADRRRSAWERGEARSLGTVVDALLEEAREPASGGRTVFSSHPMGEEGTPELADWSSIG